MAITPAQIATDVVAMLAAYKLYDEEFQDWLTGTVGGGPLSDGEYPLTARLSGTVRATKCPAQLEDDVSGIVTSAAVSAAAALVSETNAATSASNSATSATNSETYKDASVLAKSESEAAQAAAENAETTAIAQAAMALKWAEEAEDVEVTTGEYSAHHWAIKAAATGTDVSADAAAAAASAAAALVSENAAAADAILTAADAVSTAADAVATAADLVATNQDTIDTAADLVATNQDTIDTAADLVQTNLDQISCDADATAAAASASAASGSASAASTSASNASTSETNALASENLAEDWANELEDVEVTTGKYSAFHWSEKAAAFDPALYLLDTTDTLTGTLTVTQNIVAQGQFVPQQQTLTDGATINWNMDSGQTAQVTLAGNRTMAAPTNLKNGGHYTLEVHQDATGTRLITWNAVFKWPGGTAPTLTTTASAMDIISFYSDGTNLYGVQQPDFS